jgi:hypothetical protein
MKISPEKMDEYLESRLHEWGEWLRTGNFLGIGYPSRAIVQLIQEGKIVTREEKFRAVLEVNESAEEIERLVAEMSAYKRQMADCLRLYYLDNIGLRRNAKKIGISYSQFKICVLMAKQWLLGRLILSSPKAPL